MDTRRCRVKTWMLQDKLKNILLTIHFSALQVLPTSTIHKISESVSIISTLEICFVSPVFVFSLNLIYMSVSPDVLHACDTG